MASLEPTFDNRLGKKALESDQRLENGFHTSIYHVPFKPPLSTHSAAVVEWLRRRLFNEEFMPPHHHNHHRRSSITLVLMMMYIIFVNIVNHCPSE
mmetsp:Transcript_23791/g.47226  ORF Transcript_23791/g.47226 Transcript_23791/m.47226 type:complete len:96 (-) Transcript_23791:274-561(-)